MNTRMVSILQHLLAADTPVKSEHLAKLIQVTSRTVRSDIRELDEFLAKHGASIQPVRSRGYELKITDDRSFRTLLQQLFLYNEPDDPNSPEYRQRYLISRLLLTENYLKLEELADELYISKSTVQNDFKEVKHMLQTYGIGIDKRPNYGVKLRGDEVRLRFCMSEFIVNRSEEERTGGVEAASRMVTPWEMTLIRGIILEQIQNHGVTLSDVAFNNLSIHIAIACKRIRDGNRVAMLSNEREDFRATEEFRAAEHIVSHIEKQMDLTFPEDEVAYIAMHLAGNKWFEGVTEQQTEEAGPQKLLDRGIYELGREMLAEIDRDFYLNISRDQELLMGICLHLKSALNRVKYGMNIRNPMLDHVKNNYPLAFQAGVIGAKLIESKLNLAIPETEMGYLAIHIGAAMERQQMNNRPKRCLVVCTSGVGSARLLYYKLRSKFGERLEVAGTTEYYKLQQVPLHGIDFVVSTVPIPQTLSIPVVVVQTLLGGGDIDKIEELLTDEGEFTFRYIMEELVFLRQNFTTKEEIITFLGERMHASGLIRSSEGFIGLVLERENAAPTAYGNLVAIPHPIIPQSNRTVWAVCTLKSPIDWSGKPVQLVCLLSINKNGDEPPAKMYKHLMGLVDDSDIIQQMLECKTYGDFAQIIVKHKLY
ncbi:PTS fructose transporter subunit IIA [Paenibacillus sp. IHB B 3084]|uniref:BglG family transcription antiterminator n=1 Tax=Paenibacillus sp. IHB B 3084 TaxID=867076 RepID=UPI00072011E7|nr:PRD domain-containing protein [Paenibacillus sp. IHB B 3084]ALP38457.1 PTS fructose transporter subunit IIA [Paenibacillus sp. IHB B 3084]